MMHYQDDIFTWLQSRNELARRGSFTHQKHPYYMLRFSACDDNKISQLAWPHDADVPDGEMFGEESQGKRTSELWNPSKRTLPVAKGGSFARAG